MALAPQKANAQNKQTAGKGKKKEEKRERRIAPEFTLVWSEEATRSVQGRSADYVRDVTAAANARIYASEALLCGLPDVVTIGPVDPRFAFDSWWTPFRVGDLWFVLKYNDAHIREYVLCSPEASDPVSAPIVTRRQRTPPPKQIGPKPRPKKGETEARRPASRRPSRQTEVERLFFKLWDLVQTGQDTSQAHLTHSLAQLRRIVKPRLLRSLVRIRRVSGICLHAMADRLAPFVQLSCRYARLVRRISTSFTRLREFAFAEPGPGARLEARVVGQNTGLQLLLYSWIADEAPPPVDWSAHLFGVDWNLNLFGAPPEEKQVCT